MKTTIQVPISRDLKSLYEKKTSRLGYSSLQEYIRVLLKQRLDPEVVEYLTPEQEAKLRKTIAQSDKDIKNGDYIKSSNIDELMAYLNSG